MKQFILVTVLISSLGIATAAWAGNKLFVGNLPFGATSAEVNRLVIDFGTVLSTMVKSIDDNGDMSAKAEVDFASEEGADAAAAALDGLIYQGEPLTAKKAREIVVVGSKVKEVIRSAGLRSDGELVQALSDKVYRIIGTAIKRAKSNKRGTVRPYDL